MHEYGCEHRNWDAVDLTRRKWSPKCQNTRQRGAVKGAVTILVTVCPIRWEFIGGQTMEKEVILFPLIQSLSQCYYLKLPFSARSSALEPVNSLIPLPRSTPKMSFCWKSKSDAKCKLWGIPLQNWSTVNTLLEACSHFDSSLPASSN